MEEVYREAAVDIMGQAARILPKRDENSERRQQFAWFVSTALHQYGKEHKHHPADIVDGAILGLVAYLTINANKAIPHATQMIMGIVKERVDELASRLGSASEQEIVKLQLAALKDLIDKNPELTERLMKKWNISKADLKR